MKLQFKQGDVLRQKSGQLFKVLAAQQTNGALAAFYIIVTIPVVDYGKRCAYKPETAHRRFELSPEGKVLFG